VAFLRGGLAAANRSVVEGHLATCSACAELVTWAAADQANGSRSVGHEGRPFIGQLAPGSCVDRYQILGAVGSGGMGEVYAAYHPDLDRRIALKVVHEAGADSAERRARLLREARAIARLSHPNVVSVYDAGTVDGRVYIAMEFVEGETVESWLRAGSRDWRSVVDVFIAAGRGLAAAHAAGIVHRDFKPQNVMIGRDGVVRVTDFGLARLAEDPPDHSGATVMPPVALTVTKTGAVVGTPAYMAPEQFRGEAIDERADQFSFCVALHEALFGHRPRLAHFERSEPTDASPATSVPSWLRAAVSRGMAAPKEQRFSSMDELIHVLVRGRARPRRRALGVGVSVAIMLVAIGGWRAARGRGRIHCEVPTARLAAAWSGHDDSRRQAIHHAFASSGRAAPEKVWDRFAKIADDYIGQWSSMYVDTCEATHVRGEQSGEALDLRMSCLSGNLDRLRALTTVLMRADGRAIRQAIAAAADLPQNSLCADIEFLRSAVPMPRDQQTFEDVQSVRSLLREAEALRDIANFRDAHARAVALLPRAKATAYGPLVAEVLELIGGTETPNDDAEQTLHQALFVAEAARDDATAARASVDLIYEVGVVQGRLSEANTWLGLSESILKRLGPGHERLHSWALNNFASAVEMSGDLKRAESLARQSLELKQQTLGMDHPDVAITLGTLSSILAEGGQPLAALDAADRELDILARNGDPESDHFARAQTVRGQALVPLGRGKEAEGAFAEALRIYGNQATPVDLLLSFPLQGIGDARLVQRQPDAAVPVLEDALAKRRAAAPIGHFVAETQFSLARALLESGHSRKRAMKLAEEARRAFADHKFPRREHQITVWIANQRQTHR
jgi:serine/threonine protein kinase/tetratricopeptide (TPR) repeat protein